MSHVGWLSVLATVLAAGADVAQAQARITGVVTDSITGAPIGGARVEVHEAHRLTQTRQDGSFVFAGMDEGTWTIIVQRLGYRPRQVVVRLGLNEVALRVGMAPAALELAPRVVTGAIGDRPGEEVLSPTSVMSGAALDRNVGATLAATLATQPGLAVTSVGPATGRPVIRGLSGDRIVLLEDGQRPGDLSALSGDHAATIDPLTVERIEVVRGPMSLLYGASALGGVVNAIRDEVPVARLDGVHGTWSLQGSSVNRGAVLGTVLHGGTGAWAMRAEGSYRHADDTRTPVGPLLNTGVREINLGGGVSRVGTHGYTGAAYRFYANDYGIPGGFVGGHGAGVDITMRRHTVRGVADVHFEDAPIHTLVTTATFSDYGHSELEAAGVVGTRFDQQQGTLELVARHDALGPFALGALGARLTTTDFRTAGSLSTPSTRSYTAAGFVVEEVTRGAFTLQGGGRYELGHLAPRERTFIDVGGVRIPTRARTFGSVAASLGGFWKASEGVRAGVSLNRAFRMPDVNELYSNGPHLAANSFDVGDPSLRAETGLGVDAFLRLQRGSVQGEMALFRSALANFIFPSSRGRAELGSQGGRPRFQYTNEDARFEGAEGRIEWSPSTALVLDLTLSYVRARFTSTRDSIPILDPQGTRFMAASVHPPFIPPLNGSAGIRWDRVRWFASATVRGASRQARTGDFESPTAGYLVPGITAGVRVVRGHRLHAITLRLDNAFDREFRDHLSRIKEIRPEAGRNLVLLYRLTS